MNTRSMSLIIQDSALAILDKNKAKWAKNMETREARTEWANKMLPSIVKSGWSKAAAQYIVIVTLRAAIFEQTSTINIDSFDDKMCQLLKNRIDDFGKDKAYPLSDEQFAGALKWL